MKWLLIVVLAGCSSNAVGPGRGNAPCTDSYAAPILASTLALGAALGAGAALRAGTDEESPAERLVFLPLTIALLGVSVAFAVNAGEAYPRVHACRARAGR